MVMPLIAKLIIPHAINIFWIPLRWIDGVIAGGIAILTALRMSATTVKASPVIKKWVLVQTAHLKQKIYHIGCIMYLETR